MTRIDRLCDLLTQADIMVSELLGSFGDNELSPECLDGAQAFLSGECNLLAWFSLCGDE
jgi:hypothetical protein